MKKEIYMQLGFPEIRDVFFVKEWYNGAILFSEVTAFEKAPFLDR